VALGDFTGHMANLRLAHPKQMDIAVPANMRCGKPELDVSAEADPEWAPLTFSFAGIWEITPQALEEKSAEVQIVDVREPSEFTGPLGHISGATLIPLGQLQLRANEIARDRPIVTVCRAGSRSTQAYNLLRQAGFPNVANLSGGMLRWRAEGLPVEGGES
jgi:rhodanese-related sulfurtransferase